MIDSSTSNNQSRQSHASVKPRMINGSRAWWISTRILTIGLVAVLALFNFVSGDKRISAILSLLLLSLWLRVLHRTVYGFIDRGGVRCRRYFRWRTARWEDIEDIAQPFTQFSPWSIIVTLKNENLFNRRIYFSPNPHRPFRTTDAIEASFKELTRAWLAGL
jgi:hypothetical protein